MICAMRWYDSSITWGRLGLIVNDQNGIHIASNDKDDWIEKLYPRCQAHKWFVWIVKELTKLSYDSEEP